MAGIEGAQHEGIAEHRIRAGSDVFVGRDCLGERRRKPH